MFKKFVKDRAHNRYEAYCCEDIDKLLAYLTEAVEALVAGTVPDGAVTLAKLAADARTYTREINKGLLLSEWVGTHAEYLEHIEANGGQPLPNCRYTITDKNVSHAETVSSIFANNATYYGARECLASEFAYKIETGEPRFFIVKLLNPDAAADNQKERCVTLFYEGGAYSYAGNDEAFDRYLSYETDGKGGENNYLRLMPTGAGGLDPYVVMLTWI